MDIIESYVAGIHFSWVMFVFIPQRVHKIAWYPTQKKSTDISHIEITNIFL